MRIFPVLGWMLIPGCWALTGPGTERGPAGGSVTVRCFYGEGYESYWKYWYRVGPVSWGYIAQSNGTEAEVKRGRVSLRDIHRLRSFTVTVENLTPADAGTYQCGIARTAWFDLLHNVEVIVTPAVPASPKPAPIPPKKKPTVDASSTESPFISTVPEVTESNPTVPKVTESSPTVPEVTESSPTIPKVTESCPTVDSSDPPAWTIDPVLHIRTPCVLLILLLILLTAIAFIKTSQRRNKGLSALEGSPGQREENVHLYQLVPGTAPSFVTNAHLACSEAAVCTTVEETPDSAAPQPVYGNATLKDPGNRMNRRKYSWQ